MFRSSFLFTPWKLVRDEFFLISRFVAENSMKLYGRMVEWWYCIECSETLSNIYIYNCIARALFPHWSGSPELNPPSQGCLMHSTPWRNRYLTFHIHTYYNCGDHLETMCVKESRRRPVFQCTKSERRRVTISYSSWIGILSSSWSMCYHNLWDLEGDKPFFLCK